MINLGKLTPFIANMEAVAKAGLPPAPAGLSYAVDPALNVPSADLGQAIAAASQAIADHGAYLAPVVVDTKENIFGAIAGSLATIAAGPAAWATAGATLLARGDQSTAPQLQLVGRTAPMGLFDLFGSGDSGAGGGFFDSTPSSSGSSIDWGGLLQSGVGLATQLISRPAAASASLVPAVGAVGTAMRVGPLVGRTFMAAFPNLAGAIMRFKAQGIQMTAAKLLGAVKRFGPDAVVGLIGGAALNELYQAAASGRVHRRRMNPANGKALRRSLRRLAAFDTLCKRVRAHMPHVGSRRGTSKRYTKCK
jgi:hypothetical protein